jgi:DNA-binding response OmpR family regulator
LERFGYAVYVASDGFEGLEILKRERGRIRLVVLDLLLPGMSGRDVYDRIREMQADIPIVLTSGLDYNDAKESFGDLSRERYIVKPFSIYHLSQAVRHVLDNPYEP